MLSENLPYCLCGKKDWRSGGANLSSILSSQWFTCNRCNRPGVYISTPGGSSFVVPTARLDYFPEKGFEYINQILIVFYRYIEDIVDKKRSLLFSQALSTFLMYQGLPEGTTLRDLTSDQRLNLAHTTSLLEQGAAWRNPDNLFHSLPPQVPASITIFIHVEGIEDWRKVTTKETADLEIPQDPILVYHEAFYQEVFSALEAEFGPIQREIVENEYSKEKNQPWYKFSIGKITVTVGPRKRVDSVIFESKEAFNPEVIHTLAASDGVTYVANDVWANQATTVREVEVHAWTKEKLIEYLKVIISNYS